MTLRVAAIQAEARPGAVDANIHTAARLATQATTAGAEFLVFPEAFATGYDARVFAQPLPTLAEPSWLLPLQTVIDATGATAVLNTALDHGGYRGLTDLLLTPGQPATAAYRKQHLYNSERETFSPGPHGVSLQLKSITIALSVCYDANFPEHAAAAAADGASLYVNSGAYFPGGARRRDLHAAARALDNGMYVLFSGLVGSPSDFIGGSTIFDPLGRRIAQVSAGEGIAVADIDQAIVDAARGDQRMWSDRRDSLGARVNL
ncbi:carbon-nitrogen hydrolase family protein [Lysinibacter cavernae]|uniref:Putative amidohydrolase n=1 Tax=Lysinibacter cavernae TaxID=1640652 RepID=A0A7X5TS95_9MICO|nr:carbon-nitrogen hydrolase family protein [Lysinibacter cavernae]NIH53256.1 putative amidohydrolase [Lysinibacter cavernae]